MAKKQKEVQTPRVAYTYVSVGQKHRLAIVKEGEKGYEEVRPDSDLGGDYKTKKEVEFVADDMNKRLGLSKEDAAKIVAAAMFKR